MDTSSDESEEEKNGGFLDADHFKNMEEESGDTTIMETYDQMKSRFG